MLPKLRLQPDPAAAFAHHASATGNLTMPAEVLEIEERNDNQQDVDDRDDPRFTRREPSGHDPTQ